MKSVRWANLAEVSLLTVICLFSSVQLGAQDEQASAKPAQYRVFNLGTLGGALGIGNGINNRGWVTGVSTLPGNQTARATLWIYGTKLDLGTLGGANSAVEWPVKNDTGEIVGISETSTPDPLGETFSCGVFIPTNGHTCLGFLWKNGAMTPLPALGGNSSFATGLNNRSQAVGWAETAVHDASCNAPQVLQFEAVIWGPGTGQIQQLTPFPGDPDGAATAINDQGQVVGISGVCGDAVGAFSAKHAVLWEKGAVTNLGNLGGAGWNTPMAINNRGQIVGFSDLAGDVSGGVLSPNFHAFLWTKERGMQDLGTLPGDTLSEATGINDQGQVVGVSFPSSHAFLWEDGIMTDLNSLVLPGSSLSLISTGDINDRGEITGQACVLADGVCLSTSETPTFVAIPSFGGAQAGMATGSGTPKIDTPENIRRQLLQRRGLGRIAAEMER